MIQCLCWYPKQFEFDKVDLSNMTIINYIQTETWNPWKIFKFENFQALPHKAIFHLGHFASKELAQDLYSPDELNPQENQLKIFRSHHQYFVRAIFCRWQNLFSQMKKINTTPWGFSVWWVQIWHFYFWLWQSLH